MKRTAICFMLLLIVMLSACQKSDEKPLLASALPSTMLSPSVISRSKPTLASVTPIPQTPAPTPLPYDFEASRRENADVDAPDKRAVPVGFVQPIYKYTKEGTGLKATAYILDVMGGYIEGNFYHWKQFKYGDPPLRGDDFIEKYNLWDYDFDDKYPEPTNLLIRANMDFYLYDQAGKRYRTKTTGKPIISWDEGQNYLFYEYKNRLKIPGEYYVAVFGDWDAMPRKAKIIDENGSMEVDLDGDGTSETIQVLRAKAKYDDDSIMFIARYPLVSYLLTTYNVYSDGYGVYQYGKIEQPYSYTYTFPIDINGDGVMEVATGAVTSSGAEEMFIYSVTPNEVTFICGWSFAP